MQKENPFCDPVILELDYFKNIWSDMHSKPFNFVIF